MKLAFFKKPEDNFLEPLHDVIKKIHSRNITHWALQNIEAVSSYYFGLNNDDFECQSDELEKGLIVNNHEFETFLKFTTTFFSGTIVALPFEDSTQPVFILTNFDSTVWIIETNDANIQSSLLAFGWKETDEFYQDTRYFNLKNCNNSDSVLSSNNKASNDKH